MAMAIICRAYQDHLPSLPIVLHKALFAILVLLGRLMSYRVSYAEYSGARVRRLIGVEQPRLHLGDVSPRAG
jgi:hypothetical protein